MQKQGHCTYPLGLGETLYVLAYSQTPRAYSCQDYPPECQVSCTKNWTKLYGFLVYKRKLWVLTPGPPGPSTRQGYPPVLPAGQINLSIFCKKKNLPREMFLIYAMLCMSCSLSSHATHDIRQMFF